MTMMCGSLSYCEQSEYSYMVVRGGVVGWGLSHLWRRTLGTFLNEKDRNNACCFADTVSGDPRVFSTLWCFDERENWTTITHHHTVVRRYT